MFVWRLAKIRMKQNDKREENAHRLHGNGMTLLSPIHAHAPLTITVPRDIASDIYTIETIVTEFVFNF